MKFKFLAMSFLLIYCWLSSQYRCPLDVGILILPKSEPNLRPYVNPDYTNNNIRSQNNQVISISDGKISKIITHTDNSKSIIIKSDNNEFFVYSNLENILFNINDKIEKNQILGEVLPTDKSKENYLLNFQLWKKSESVKIDLKCKSPN